METDRVGCLLQADERVAMGFELFQGRRQRAVNFNVYLIGAVAGDRAVDFWTAAGDEARDAAAAGGADDVGEIDVASHRGEADDEVSWARERNGRLVALVFEFWILDFGFW